MLTCHNLTCTRGDNIIFSQLGFTVGNQTAVLVVGPNGSGKTSLLKMAAGLMKPAEGEVQWFKEPLHSVYSEYSREMVYIGHKNALKLELTVKDNILLWSQMRRTEAMYEAALHYFSLSDKRDIPCYMLSAGWQRRVALARLLACYARLWILDEPMTNLDEEGKLLMVNLINSRTSQGGIVLLSSHAPLPLSSACEIDMRNFSHLGN